jgi:hypothetical protein
MTNEAKCSVNNAISEEQDSDSSVDENGDFCFSSDSEDKTTKAGEKPKRNPSNSLKVRMQKNLVGRMINGRHSIKPLIGHQASQALKSFEHLLKAHLGSKSETKQVMRPLIKTAAKFGVILRNNGLDEEQKAFARSVKSQLRTTSLTFISFVRMDYTYDRQFLIDSLIQCQQNMRRCAAGVLSEKSHERINFVFSKLTDPKLLDAAFSPSATPEQRTALTAFADDLERVLEME